MHRFLFIEAEDGFPDRARQEKEGPARTADVLLKFGPNIGSGRPTGRIGFAGQQQGLGQNRTLLDQNGSRFEYVQPWPPKSIAF